MPTMTPCLWFDDNAEDAVHFYTSIFPNSKTVAVTRYGGDVAKAAHRPEGSVMTIAFELDGKPFLALNGGPMFKFSEAISFIVQCAAQKEIDDYWEKLTADGGQPGQCGWLKDRFGVSWQVVPANMTEVMARGDAAKHDRLMKALLTMKKLDAAALMRAYEGGVRSAR